MYEFVYITEIDYNIYQICRTTKFKQTLLSDILFSISCKNSFNTKIAILDILQNDNKYINKTEYGHDYFYGDIDDIIRVVYNTVIKK